MAVFFLALFLVLLCLKLLLGMSLLQFARNRYRGMKARELAERSEKETERRASNSGVGSDTGKEAKRVGGFGLVDVDDEKKKWIYGDDKEGLRVAREREQGGGKKEVDLGIVTRYGMHAKRIW
jgi:hypothetical protein